ncbi:MAG TPA: hypothetical protein VFZ61_31860 [Polyangiales bacterium]
MQRQLLCLAVAAVLGCGGATTAFVPTGPTLAALPDSCDFSVVASPAPGSTELGTIELKYMKQTDWIYDEKAFKRKVRTQVCRSGGDSVVARINDNGLYMSGTVLTTKAVAAPPAAEPSAPAPSEPETTAEAAPVAAPPAATAAPQNAPAAPAKSAAAKPDKGAQAAAKPEAAKDDEAVKAVQNKKGNKKGASAKKDQDIRGKDGKVDIDKLL